MLSSDPLPSSEPVSTGKAFRHLLIFQFKLALDALRDLALSPLSLLVFLLDAILKPPVEESLYLRLMQLGQRSDRAINLFNEHGGEGHYTVDQAISDVELAVQRPGKDKIVNTGNNPNK